MKFQIITKNSQQKLKITANVEVDTFSMLMISHDPMHFQSCLSSLRWKLHFTDTIQYDLHKKVFFTLNQKNKKDGVIYFSVKNERISAHMTFF